MWLPNEEHSAAVTASEGDRVRARRRTLGMSQAELAEEAGVNRDTLAAIEKNEGYRSSSLAKVLDALSRIEEEVGMDAPRSEPDPGLIEFEVTGDFGVRVFVRGPVADADALERSVARLVRNIREGGPHQSRD